MVSGFSQQLVDFLQQIGFNVGLLYGVGQTNQADAVFFYHRGLEQVSFLALLKLAVALLVECGM